MIDFLKSIDYSVFMKITHNGIRHNILNERAMTSGKGEASIIKPLSTTTPVFLKLEIFVLL